VPPLPRPTTPRARAGRVGLAELAVTDYLERWAAKGLLRLD